MAKAPAQTPTPAKQSAGNNSNIFGELINQFGAVKSLFGGQGETVPNQQGFSNQPAQENLGLQNSYANQAALQNLNISKEAGRFGSQAANQSYQARSAIDLNQARELRSLNQGSGGGLTTVGRGAWVDPNTIADPFGMSGSRANFQGLRDFSDRQNMAAQSEGLFGAIAARNEGLRARELAMAQVGADQIRQNMNIDLMNRQASLDSQSNANNFLRQRELAGQQLASNERVAGIQAQGNILASLFGSVGAGSPNYRYWG